MRTCASHGVIKKHYFLRDKLSLSFYIYTHTHMYLNISIANKLRNESLCPFWYPTWRVLRHGIYIYICSDRDLSTIAQSSAIHATLDTLIDANSNRKEKNGKKYTNIGIIQCTLSDTHACHVQMHTLSTMLLMQLDSCHRDKSSSFEWIKEWDENRKS